MQLAPGKASAVDFEERFELMETRVRKRGDAEVPERVRAASAVRLAVVRGYRLRALVKRRRRHRLLLRR